MQGKIRRFSPQAAFVIHSCSIAVMLLLALSGCGEKLDLDLGTKAKPQQFAKSPPPTNLSWSPDGEWILYLSDLTVKIMGTDESRKVITLTGTGLYDNPVWSPKGDRIAYDLSSDFGLPDIWVKDVFKKIVPVSVTADFFIDSNPTWSADGRRIAFQSMRSGNWDIWVANAVQSSSLIQLTSSPKSDENPVWSPDNSKIAFSSDRSGKREVWVADPSKIEAEKQFSFSSNRSYGARWSHDSSKIAYLSDISGESRILVKGVNGDEKPVDIGASNVLNYDWAASDRAIAYESGGRIWGKLIDAKSDLIHIADGVFPALSPDGLKIAYVQFEASKNSFSIKIGDLPAAVR